MPLPGVNTGDDVAAGLIKALISAWTGDGTPEANSPLNLVSVDDATHYAATIRNLGAGGALKVLSSAGATLLDITDAGVTGNFPSGIAYENIKSHGAVGNGTTDDTAAISAAIAAVSGGGVVYFPPGTYRITSAISVSTAGVTLMGSGRGSVIKAGNSAALYWLVQLNADGCSVRHLKIDGNRTNGGTSASFGRGIDIGAARKHSRILHCEIAECQPFGIQIATATGTDDVLIFGCYIHDIGPMSSTLGDGIFTSGTPAPTNIRIIGNRIETCYGKSGAPQGAAIAGGFTDLLVAFNSIADCFNGGGMIVANLNGHADWWRIVGNYLSVSTSTVNGVAGVATGGLELTGARYYIAGNHFVWTPQVATAILFEPIGANSVNDAMVIGNICTGMAGGIGTADTATSGLTTDLCIIGNRVSSCLTGIGITVQTVGSRIYVALNDLNDNVAALSNAGGALCFSNLGASGPSVTGSRGGNVALASLLGVLGSLRTIADNTSV